MPKLFVLVEGGSHHNTNSIGEAQYRSALLQLFRMKPETTLASRQAEGPPLLHGAQPVPVLPAAPGPDAATLPREARGKATASTQAI